MLLHRPCCACPTADAGKYDAHTGRAGQAGEHISSCDVMIAQPLVPRTSCFCWDASSRQGGKVASSGLCVRKLYSRHVLRSNSSSSSCAAMRRLCDATRPAGTDLLLPGCKTSRGKARGGMLFDLTLPLESVEGLGPERCSCDGGSCKIVQRSMLGELITARYAVRCRLRAA